MAELENVGYEQFAQLYAAGIEIPEIAVRQLISRALAYRRWGLQEIKDRVSELTQMTLTELGIDKSVIMEATYDIAMSPLASFTERNAALKQLAKYLGMEVLKIEDITERGHDEWTKLLISEGKKILTEKIGNNDFLK